MKKLKILFLALLSLVVLSSCEEEKETKEELTIKEGVLDLLKDFSKEGSSKNLEFKASHAWEITGAADWITIAPKTGAAGDAVVKISVTANETHADREVKITIAIGTTIKEEITIIQKQTDAVLVEGEEPEPFDTAAGTFTIKVKHNVGIDVAIVGDWVTRADETKVLEPTDVKFDYTANTTNAVRTATITISGVEGSNAGEPVTYTVTQKQLDALVGDEEPIKLPFALGTFSINIEHNIDYTVNIVDGAWITETTTRALTPTELTFSYTANATDGERTAKIEISGEGVTTLTYNVVQDFEAKITFNADDIELLKDIPSAGDAIELKFKATHDWTITETVDWLTVAPMEGVKGDMTVTVTAIENTLYEPRTATIKISEVEVTITQIAAVLKITANCIIVNPSPGTVTVPINNVNVFWGIGGDGAIATEMGDEWKEPNLEAPAVIENLISDGTYVAELIWSDVNVTPTIGTKTATGFEVSGLTTAGNYIVGVKRNAEVTDYLWSWHLWVTDFDPNAGAVTLPNERVAMDRNLGAMDAVMANTATPNEVGTLGLMYQWGRKDPFPGASAIMKTTVRETWPAALPTTVGNGTLLSIVGKPNVYSASRTMDSDAINKGHLSLGKGHNRWGGATNHTTLDHVKNAKSIYDPCPEGWRMPWGRDWSGFAEVTPGAAETSELKLTTDGWYVNPGRTYTDASGNTTWFSAPGELNSVNGKLYLVGRNGWYWSGSPDMATGGCIMRFAIAVVYPKYTGARSLGSPVRPVQDE